MQQISPPLRIALAAILVLAAVWFVALRPKGGSDEPKAVTAPGVEGLANSVEGARNAKEAADAAVKRNQDAATAVDGSTGTATPSKTRVVTGSGSSSKAAAPPSGAAARRDARRLAAALDRGKAVVLLFRNRSSDSAHNARVVRGIDKRDGRVATRVTSITQIGNYAIFTSETTATQAPTTYVIGPKGKAKVIVGYTSTGEVDQAIGDVLGKRSGQDRFGKGRGRDSNG